MVRLTKISMKVKRLEKGRSQNSESSSQKAMIFRIITFLIFIDCYFSPTLFKNEGTKVFLLASGF